MNRKDFFVKIGSFLLVIGWIAAIAKLFASSRNSGVSAQPQPVGYGHSGNGSNGKTNIDNILTKGRQG